MGNIDNDIQFLGTNFGALKNNRFQGWLLGAGIGYGYAFVLDSHWNLELELGIGYAYLEYDKYDWKTDQRLEHLAHHNYFGITKLNVGISYLF
jgi:putative salt-induced outer membrane protein YdiY